MATGNNQMSPSEALGLPQFQYQTLSEPSQIRIATISPGELKATLKLELEHANIECCSEYECLSYAWEQDGGDQPIMLNGSRLVVSSALQAALYCLRDKSQERKVWIDAICINQADIQERNRQVAIMRQIYRKATRVVVWIGSATESSEQAMEFLKTMARAKKNYERGHYIGGKGRVASDTTSELGPGDGHDDWFPRENSAPIGSDSSDSADPHDVEPIPKPSYEEDTENNEILHSEDGSKSDPIEPPPPVEDLMSEYVQSPEAQLREEKIWAEYGEARATEEATKNTFVVTGFPVLYNMFGNTLEEYFQDEWQEHWQSLDDLLARRWWGRTWIVQEIWSASNAILQCGTTTIKWKTFQKAMDYSEAWDDMGDSVRGTKRQEQWETLRRRYTLAIHLAKERLNGSTLSSLLWNTWDRACTDPRDKVFAMLPLVGESEKVSMRPDYGKSMQQVYREVARDIIVDQGQIDILLAASGADGENDLPSWVPDWRCEANAKKPTLLVNRRLMMQLYISGSMDMVILDGHGYRASGDSKPLATFSEDLSMLTLSGMSLDSVAEVCDANIVDMDDAKFTDKAFDFVLQSKFISSETREVESSHRQDNGDSQDTSALLRTLTGGGKVGYDEWAPTMRNIMRERRLFVSRNGHMGIGPVQAQPEDVIYIISGCNFPIMLRPRGDRFAVVGEVYIHGFMSGEALASKDSQANTWEEIQIL